MTAYLLCMGALILLPTAEQAADAKKETASLQGTWAVLAFDREGKAMPEEEVKAMKVAIKNNSLVFVSGKEFGGRIGFKLGPGATPKQIDLFLAVDDPPKMGIYELDGDQLKLCWHASDKRPSAFPAKPDRELTMLVLKRSKERPPDFPIENQLPEQARALFEKADQLELLSLEPKPKVDPQHEFHGWKVLGKMVVKDKETRQKLLTSMNKGVEGNYGKIGACFNPRHGIRVTHDGKTVDFVICFECYRAEVYLDGKERDGFLTTASPQAAFDEVLRDAKVPLAKTPKEK